MMSEQGALTAETVIDDRYRLVSEGRARDLGTAFRAYDLQEDRLVDLLVVSARWGSGQDALERLQQVEQTLRGLASPALLPNGDPGLVSGLVYLIRPQAGGRTLADLLARGARLDEKAAVELTIRLCEALAPAHSAGLTHGGLSTDSILLKETETAEGGSATEVVLLDTGLLPALRPPGSSDDGPWGRLPYISPEQAAGLDIQPASDVYVIGALLYEMLIGRPPFHTADEAVLALQHLHQEPPSLQIMDTRISKTLAQIVYRTLAKEPSARYRNAGQLAHILRAQLGPQPELARARERHLVVPPPPLQPASTATDTWWSSAASYGLQGDGARAQPSQQGVDWLMVALIIAALVAVLGLIPLWNAVYNRYDSAAVGSLHARQLEAGSAASPSESYHLDDLSERNEELEGQAVLCYNVVQTELSLAHQRRKSLRAGDLSGNAQEAPGSGT